MNCKLVVALCIVAIASFVVAECPVVPLPATSVPAVGGQCPGTPAAVVTSAPYEYNLPADYRFDFAYVKEKSGDCKLVLPNTFVKCFYLSQQSSKYTVHFSGSAACKEIAQVSFYATNCPTCPECPCGVVGDFRRLKVRGRNLRNSQAIHNANAVCPVCATCPPTPSPTPAPETD